MFVEHATLIPSTEQRGGNFDVISPEGFVHWINAVTPIGSADDKGFAEEEIHNIVHRYGDIVQVFSTCQKHFWDDDQILGRVINSFQLVHNNDRWWIVSIVWDEEIVAFPLPDAYLSE